MTTLHAHSALHQEQPIVNDGGVAAVGLRLGSLIDFARCSQRFGVIQGYLHDLEGYALLLLAEHAEADGVALEIGSFMGRSTAWLAEGSRRAGRGQVVAVDHFTGSPEHQPGGTHPCPEIAATGTTFGRFESNLRSVGLFDEVRPIRAASDDAGREWDGPIRVLFIDGDHSYEMSRRDFELWTPHVSAGGFVALHDVGAWEGVTRFYNELIAGGEWEHLFAVNSLRVIRRRVTPVSR